MSLKRAVQSLVSSLGSSGVRLRLDDSVLPQVKRELKKAKKIASERGGDVLKDSAKSANAFAASKLSELGRNVKSRYRNRDVPQIDPLTRRSFPKSYPLDRTGSLRQGLIRVKTTRRKRVTFNEPVEASIDIRAASVPVREDKQGEKWQPTKYPDLISPWKQPISSFGGDSDLFSMMEYGTGHMRYSNQSYTTFSGEYFAQTQGYFTLDRIVKDEFFRLSKTFNEDLRDEIRKKFK